MQEQLHKYYILSKPQIHDNVVLTVHDPGTPSIDCTHFADGDAGIGWNRSRV